MKNAWKNFLYFSAKEKISCILLLFIVVLFITVYIATGNLMKVTPEEIRQQEILNKEFEEYQASFISKEVISEDNSIHEDVEQTSENKKENVSKNLSKNKKAKLISSQIIDINTASIELLTRVPGIGKATAKKIIEYRNLLGGYSHLEQLVEIQGISINKLSNVLPYLTIQKRHKTVLFYKQNIQLLQHHPYLKKDQLELLKDLKREQNISSIDELIKYYQFKQSDIDRLSPYLDFSK